MRILAVIPARAGSKGIPNKNIRIVAGHPLIYYTINNAINSQFITDIIVTTDSEKVKVIAKQMGVNIKERRNELCGDDITLDSVIYDAIPKNEEYDYIITMQPTSPTLSVDTLDNAIKYTIENNLDTVISAINAPHLSWRKENGRNVPNYIERLNRQYLPANYLETGAFVVSKRSVVTETTRIGDNVDIYEIPESESQDIDNFTDLFSAENTLSAKKIAFYVNGNNERGTGHIYRALELADEFYVKPDIYYDENQTNIAIFGKTTHNLIPVDGVGELFEKCKQNQYDIFINDILATSMDYMNGLRKSLPLHSKIINFEDDGEGIVAADLVFNALYHDASISQMYEGEDYYICNKLFMFYNKIEIKENVKNVFISFGGADPQNYSDRLLDIISGDEYKAYNFIVILGRAKENIETLLEYNSRENISVLYDIDNMPEIMSGCDIAVTSRGRTGYELAILGVPTIAMAQNKQEEKHGFVCEENGFDYIGLNPDDEVIKAHLDMYLHMKRETRQKYQDMMLGHNLKNGRKHVMGLINGL